MLFRAGPAVASCVTVALVATANTSAAATVQPFTVMMRAASDSRGVPLPLIEAIAYVNSRWEWIAAPSIDGGVGPMKVLPSQMARSAQLSGQTTQAIATNAAANLDAGASLLADAHRSGASLDAWRPAVAETQGNVVAAQVYAALRRGERRTTQAGEVIVLAPQPVSQPEVGPLGLALASGAAAATVTPDYSGATWVPASPANYTVADRPHDYGVDMIVIHDTEGSFGSAIQAFQDPARAASAHYVVSDQGQVVQMVLEKDVAWHAGNWDYNTRAIGIEHEGYAWTPGWYTQQMYDASARLAASICSRWGVPMDRQHVIGHNEVPDPDNPGLFGGSDHHTDPGPYWDWNLYMSLAQRYAAALPSPPHLGPDPMALPGDHSATVRWHAARSCSAPITGYTITGQPGGLTMSLPATATSATFTGLQNWATYTFTVTATNSFGSDSLTSVPVIPQVSLGGAMTSDPEVVSNGANRMDAFVRSTDNAIWQTTWNGTSWQPWTSLGGTLTSSLGAVARAGNRIELFARGTDNALWHRGFDGTKWWPWESLGGSFTSGPAATAWGTSRIDVFARGTDQALWHRFWDGSYWHPWQSLGGTITTDPAAIAWGPNRLDVFARGTDYAEWHRAWDGTKLTPWESLGGYLDSSQAVSSCAPGALDVFAVDGFGVLVRKSFGAGAWSGWRRISGEPPVNGPGAVCRSGQTAIDIVQRGADNALWQLELPS